MEGLAPNSCWLRDIRPTAEHITTQNIDIRARSARDDAGFEFVARLVGFMASLAKYPIPFILFSKMER